MAAVGHRVVGEVDGKTVKEFTFTNASGMELKVLTYGAIVSSLVVPGKDGPADVALGFASLDDWATLNVPYMGAVVGRVGNRIAGGKFSLDGQEYTLAVNNGSNHLHGGIKGFDKRVWEDVLNADGSLTLTLVSPDGEEGYPGTLTAKVTYRLTEANALQLDYHVVTTKATPVNLTNHCYFNLAGAGTGTIKDHRLRMPSTHITEAVDLIPTGNLLPVSGTPFDFREGKLIGQDLAQVENGYDNNFIVVHGAEGDLALAASVSHEGSGRTMEVHTTEPGVQLYTGGFLANEIGREGVGYAQFFGFCLETQHFPDSVHQPGFPTVILRPGQEYTSQTIYSFSF